MDTLADDPPLELVFRGECLEGYDPAAVRATLAKALKLDQRRADRLFSGRRIVVRRNVDVVAAHRYIAKFAMMGAVLQAEPQEGVSEEPPAPLPPPAPPPPPAALPVLKTAAHDSRFSSSTLEYRPRKPRWMRWLGTGIGCVMAGAALGLLLGPGFGSPSTASVAPAPVARMAEVPPPVADPAPVVPVSSPPVQQVAQARPAAPPPVEPAAPAPERIPVSLTPTARGVYTGVYRAAQTPKSLAISPTGAYGWASGADAVALALSRCNAAKAPGDPPCETVNIDGNWLQ